MDRRLERKNYVMEWIQHYCHLLAIVWVWGGGGSVAYLSPLKVLDDEQKVYRKCEVEKTSHAEFYRSPYVQ